MFSLAAMLGKDAPEIHVVDVGALWLDEESIDYLALVKCGLARVVGFEPVEKECARLNGMGRPHHRFLPYFIGDGARRTFRLCHHTMTSSLYEPNHAFLERFTGLADLSRVVERSEVQTRRLDDVAEIGEMDILKADVQGAERDVLAGATRRLGGAVVVHVESEFVPMYEGQPLFGDIDVLMRSRGYLLHCFKNMWGWPVRPFEPPPGGAHQVMWADAVYVRDVMRWLELSATQLLKLAVILHEVYGSYDLAAHALEHHDAKVGGGTLWRRYVDGLTGAG